VNEQGKSGPASGVPTIIDQYITCRLQGRQENVEPGCLEAVWPVGTVAVGQYQDCSLSPFTWIWIPLSDSNTWRVLTRLLQHFDCCDGSFPIPVRGFVGHDDTKIQHHSNLIHTYIHTYIHIYIPTYFVCPSTYLPSKPTLLRSELPTFLLVGHGHHEHGGLTTGADRTVASQVGGK